jgi:hypothetical protein
MCHQFLHFLTGRPAHASVIWCGSLFASSLSTAWCRMLGSQVTNKQTGPDPLFLEPWNCNKETTHSDTLSVFHQLQSWLWVEMFCKRTIFCVSYMWMHVLISDYSDNDSSDSDNDIPTASSHKQLRSSTGSLTPQFPHPFFLTLWVGTILNPFGRPGILVRTGSKHRIQGNHSKFGPCMNVLFRYLGYYRAQNKNVSLDEVMIS